jgi:hypothetical protein
MVNPKSAAKLIRQHFEELTTEKFVENLHRSCPEVFEDNEQLATPAHRASQEQDTSNSISSDEVKPKKANI